MNNLTALTDFEGSQSRTAASLVRSMYSDKQNCYNVWYFCSVHNVVCACVGISLSIGETV